MKKIIPALACAIALMAGCSKSAVPATENDHKAFDGKMIVGYYPVWNGAQFRPDYDRLSLICLAFAHMKADGTLDYEQLHSAKSIIDSAHAKGVKVIVSLRDTRGVSEAIASDSLRASLARQARECIEALDLDGVDVDYEEWGGDDVTKRLNLEKFYMDIRSEIGDGYLMTAAVRAPTQQADWLDSALLSHLDYVFPMTYDECGAEGEFGWGQVGQHSSYDYFCKALDFFTDSLKVPAQKLCMGVPFYGYEFPNSDTTAGGHGVGYSKILESHPELDASQTDSIGLLWYNGVPTMRRKCEYAVEKGVAGIMIWEITTDSDDPDKSLLRTIRSTLDQAKQGNAL